MRVEDRRETVPSLVEKQIEEQLGELNQLLSKYPYLPGVIKAISDHFQVSEMRKTPWSLDGAFHGYLAYFHTLNSVRVASALQHLKRVIGDTKISSVVDFGSGLGAAHSAFSEVFPDFETTWHYVESNNQVATWHKKIHKLAKSEWSPIISPALSPADLFVSSYALNELGHLPDYALSCDHIVIVEPSHRDHSRQLMKIRSQLIERGFHILAPCTHKLDCPLLKHSKNDFCHDRIHFDQPPWFQKIEAELPMKNQTLTFSYLIASKSIQPKLEDHHARMIGDTLKEKGKTRQAVCRNDEREFLSWLKRYGEAQYLPHGSLVRVPEGLEKKGNELRCKPDIPIEME